MLNFKMKSKFAIAIFIVGFVLSPWIYAQGKAGVEEEVLYDGTIVIKQDSRVQDLVERHMRQNKKKQGIDGFRIQLLFNSGPSAREQATRMKAEFLSAFPGYPVYVLYQTPYYKVRIGDFKTKREALRVYHLIQKKYPTAFIVNDIVKFSNIE